MKLFGSTAFRRIPLAFSALLLGFAPQVALAQSYTVSATNVVMSASGYGSTLITVTSVGGYTGTIYLDCKYAGQATSAFLPICSGYTMANDFPLAANQSFTTTRPFYAYGLPIPVRRPVAPRGSHAPPVLAALIAGALFGSRLRSGFARWLSLVLLGIVILTGTGACGGKAPLVSTTPGTYTYSITATDINTNVTVATTILVAVQ